ncbi:flavin reductase family protein [Streptomyces sp. NPDC005708]|uniref:flavin reductase family protein n=1 Tax=Streptomyces sp. NPDC005708 TaxID=3154564 RepID=UPI0033DB744A
MFDPQLFRQAISRFATGVAVVTTRHQDRDSGMTASAVTSLCVDPPMLLVCVNQTAPTHNAIRRSDTFVVNVLASGQEHLAQQFARPAPDKFAGVPKRPGNLGAPVIEGTVAHFECEVRDRLTGGTHTIFVGEVVDAGFDISREPLVYYSSGFGRFGAADAVDSPEPQPRIPELVGAAGGELAFPPLGTELFSCAWEWAQDDTAAPAPDHRFLTQAM